MATEADAAKTYSFISQLRSDPILSKFGENGLPLFAVGLYLDVEDMGSFATESLTDHPQDKKADIIFIDESEKIACIAQGYVSTDWGRPAAPANKASDLNTAAAWLLRAPIGSVPDAIRKQAQLLREGLESNAIAKIVFAYAHNALESKNVDAELQTLRHLLAGLPLVQGCVVEVVELGLRKIEELYLTSRGSIQVTDAVVLPAKAVIEEEGPGWRASVLSVSGVRLFDLYEQHGNALFSANLRDFLGSRKIGGNVNNQIKDTAETRPGEFFVLNNGITMVTKKAELDTDAKTLTMHGVSIVNGAQTTGAIHAAGAQNAENVAVLARVISVEDEAKIRGIVVGNNTQNSIEAWDRKSNNAVQIRIREEFERHGVVYVHRRDNTRNPAKSLWAEQVGQMLCAFGGDLQTAIRARADIFESDLTYNKVFPASISIGHVFAVQALGWAYDSVKQELKAKDEAGKLTQIEQAQLRLLDYAASKQFLLYVAGKLREEIAGAKIPEPSGIELKAECIVPDGSAAMDAWVKVIKAILPQMVQGLPDEEYRVVRSSEMADKVAKTTQGIVAGVQALQDNFGDLRVMLKPTW